MAVSVVGGGPAGLMAAEVLATAGVAVTVHERMPSVGRKLLLAGRGGLNLTHSEDLDRFLERYGPARARLEPAIRAFGPDELRAWAAGLGQDPFVGSSGRVFPSGFRATPLLRAWLRRLDDLGVEIRTRSTWSGWEGPGATVLAMGGASWPRTGSDGAWVGALGAVRVAPLRPANCGFRVAWSEAFRERFAGTPLKDVVVRFGDHSARGDAMITDTGIEGGPVYALAAALREAERPVLTIDLRPDLTDDEYHGRVTRRRTKDSISNALRRAGFSPVASALVRATDGHPKCVPLALLGPQPIARAISTAGGVAFDEVDDRFMLRAHPGTFVAGEMLDWEAPTGGYLLQAAFSTGVAAARGLVAWLDERVT